MKKETWSIAFACALGAFVGALSALEISARFVYGSYFWAIGALLGGVVAYVAIDFRKLCTGIACAYRTTIAWRPDGLFWGTFFIAWLGLVTAILSLGSVMVGLLCYADDSELTVKMVGFMLTMMTVLTSALAYSGTAGAARGDDRIIQLQGFREMGWWFIRYTNPFGLLMSALIGIMIAGPMLAAWFMMGVAWLLYEGVPKVRQFAKQAFIYVHSQRRTICFVDATIGATIGYCFGSAIVGAVIGAILGTVNYEIVSIRWLKIVPAKAK